MEEVTALRQSLYLTRDGSEAERAKRTSTVAELGLALHGCNVRRYFRGHESKVRFVAAGLLQVAVDRHYGSADGDFWVRYAQAQFRAFKQLGACADAALVRGAYDGWERASALAGPEGLAADLLTERAEVQLLAGDFRGAAASLGHLVERAASDGPERRVVILRVAMLYQHALHHHAQAVALIYRLAAAGGVASFNNADLLFLLARAYLDWSRHQSETPPPDGDEPESAAAAAARLQEADALRDTAKGLFAKLFHSLQASGGVEGDTVEAWLATAATWRDLGDKCAYTHLDLYAADMYEEGARRDPDGAGRAHWYRLAKVQRRCGRHDLALGALNCAIDRSPGDGQLRAVAATWEAESDASGSHGTKTIEQYVASLPPITSLSSFVVLTLAAIARGKLQRKCVVFKEDESPRGPPPAGTGTRDF